MSNFKHEIVWCLLKCLSRLLNVSEHPVVVVFDRDGRVEMQRDGESDKQVRQFGVILKGGCTR